MKNKKAEKILIYTMFCMYCILCAFSIFMYVDYYYLNDSITEVKVMYHSDMDDALSRLRSIEKDKFFVYYNDDVKKTVSLYENIREEMTVFENPLKYVVIEESYKISKRYGRIPVGAAIIEKVY